MKSRNIPIYDFLDILQKEYVCSILRSKIYPRISDKKYHKKVAEGKLDKIIDISKRNSIPCVEDKEIYNKYWKEVVVDYGYPKFIYNQKFNRKNSNFPYKGAVVEILDKDRQFQYGISNWVEFNEESVYVSEREGGESTPFHYSKVRMLSMDETDKMFYYYPNNEFKYIIDNQVEIGILTNFDYENNLAYIKPNNRDISYPHIPNKISRIL